MRLLQVDQMNMTSRLKSILSYLVALVLLSMSGAAIAQHDADGVVSTGTAKSEAMADRMRMTLTISAKGADMEKAIEILNKRRKNAKIKMEKLGVIEDSIEFDVISAGGSGGAQQAQIMQAMVNQARGDKRLEGMLKVKPPASVQVSVTADWELDSDLDATQMLITTDKLKSQILAAEIDSASEKDELSAAQEELAEEMAEMSNRYGNEEGATGPKFSYVRTVSADDVDQLVAQAVADAKKKAQQLAKSAGVKIGAIYRVAKVDSAQQPNYYDPYGGYQATASSSTTDDDGTLHAVSESPMVSVSRSIAFAFKIESE